MKKLFLVGLVCLSGACAGTTEQASVFFSEESGDCGEIAPLAQSDAFCDSFGGVAYEETLDGWYQLGCVEGSAMSIEVESGEGVAFTASGECQSSYTVAKR